MLKLKHILLTLTIIYIILINFVLSQSTTLTFNYTGNIQTWIVPPCVTSINVTLKGGKGGGINGGLGSCISHPNIPVTPGQILQINVGGMGNLGLNSGGWNGGGTGKTSNILTNHSGGGGGGSDIRISPYALGNRIIIAGGGGGMGGGTTDAAGGNAICVNGNNGSSTFGGGGGGGTQALGGFGGIGWGAGTLGLPGILGTGGAGATDNCYNVGPGGGGGGGYYGGGGGGADCFQISPYGGGGGGGGSSLIPLGGSCIPSCNNTNGVITIIYTLIPIVIGPIQHN
jgi:hypothetical protein